MLCLLQAGECILPHSRSGRAALPYLQLLLHCFEVDGVCKERVIIRLGASQRLTAAPLQHKCAQQSRVLAYMMVFSCRAAAHMMLSAELQLCSEECWRSKNSCCIKVCAQRCMIFNAAVVP